MAITFLHKRVAEKGFSLLEMSIVVVIIGFTISMGVVTFNQYSKLSKAELTRSRMEVIIKALDDYADKYDRLPCPADGSLTFRDNEFGLGLKVGVTDVCANFNYDTSDTYVGAVPVNTLNIYPTFALDGWGNRFSYVVKHATVVSGSFTVLASSYITLTNYIGASPYNGVVVAVISHGENGLGAWKGSGVAKNTSSANAKEILNSTASSAFVASLPYPGFDDIVYFLTKPQITNNDFE